LTIVVIATVIALVNGHAAMIKPLAWNGPNPTNGPQPCGTQTNKPLASAAAIWPAGATITDAVEWKIIAGDGAGPITASLDLAGGHDFSAAVPVTLIGTSPTNVGTQYSFKAVAPTVTCTGPTGADGNPTCTLQIKGPNGWVGCSTIAITGSGGGSSSGSVAAVTVNTNPVCVNNVQGLTFCTKVNGHRVLIPFGMDAATLDANTFSTYNATYNNHKVFFSHLTPGCSDAYADYMCGMNFPLCTNPALGPCQVTCSATVQLCGLNATHKNLYDCSQLVNAGADSNGNCASGVSSYGTPVSTTAGSGGLHAGAFTAGTFAALVATLLALASLNFALRQ